MNSKQRIKASKCMSFLLRHGGVPLDPMGWATIADVLAAVHQRGLPVTPTILREIVDTDEKQRYSLDGARIRANQGHSVAVDLGLRPIEPPAVLFHGTAAKSLGLIWRDGLLPMGRQYVHLSQQPETANVVGRRHGEPVILTVRAYDMFMAGHPFYRSANGVWLTLAVPIEFLEMLDAIR